MTIYFYLSLFLMLILSAVLIEKKKINLKRELIYSFLAIILILISAFRWKVGGDWETYLVTYERSNLSLITFQWSFIFEIINFIFSRLGTGIYGVNLFIASTFFLALYRLGKILDLDIILLLLLSFSLIYFNGIFGYARQTLSLTLIIFSLEFIFRNKPKISIMIYLLSIFTHISSIIFIPIFTLLIFNSKKDLIIFLLFILMALIFGFRSLSTVYSEFLYKGMVSAGSLFRSFPLAVSCIIYIIFRGSFLSKSRNYNFILDYLCFLSVCLIFIIFLSSSLSAIADRLSFYLTIFQLIIIGNFFRLIIKPKNNQYLSGIIFVSLSYFFITFAWFLFGDYSIYWLDYNFMFLR